MTPFFFLQPGHRGAKGSDPDSFLFFLFFFPDEHYVQYVNWSPVPFFFFFVLQVS